MTEQKPLVLAINPQTGDVLRVTEAQEAKDIVEAGWGLIATFGKGCIEAAIEADMKSAT